jgi:hypothetical protein
MRRLDRSTEALRPSDSPTRTLAGTPYPTPCAWLTRCARSRSNSH